MQVASKRWRPAVATRPGLVAVLVSTSTPALAVAARAADVDLSCHELIAQLAREFGGRGGGKPDLAQCGGLQGTPDAVLNFARARLAGGQTSCLRVVQT